MKKTNGALAGFSVVVAISCLFFYLLPPGWEQSAVSLFLYGNTIWFAIASGLMVGFLVAADGR